MHFIVISALAMSVVCQNRLPSPPEVIFGGFIPMVSDHKIENKHQIQRNSKSLNKYVDATSRLSVEPSFPSSIPRKHKFAPSEALGSFPEPRNGKTLFRPQQEFHRDSLPQFPLWIPKKHTFGLEDAVGSTPSKFPSNPLSELVSDNSLFSGQSQSNQVHNIAPSEQMIAPTSEDQFVKNDQTDQVFEGFHPDQDLDSTPADQFLVPNILNFFHNPKIPATGNRPNRPNRFKRPPRPNGPPPSQTSGTTFNQVLLAQTPSFSPVTTQTSSFSPITTQTSSFTPVSAQTSSFSPVPISPVQISFQQQIIPDLQKQEPNLDEALKIFNDGLDNFISNPGSFNEFPRPRPVNNFSGTKPMLVIPPGLTIEEKTKFLSDRDPNQNFILSAPSVNAGVLPLKLHKQQPLILFPPLNKPLNDLVT